MLAQITSAEYAGIDRKRVYDRGGPMFVSGRILVVDLLLQKYLRPTQIAGLVIVNAEKVTETCAEAFIARLYR